MPLTLRLYREETAAARSADRVPSSDNRTAAAHLSQPGHVHGDTRVLYDGIHMTERDLHVCNSNTTVVILVIII